MKTKPYNASDWTMPISPNSNSAANQRVLPQFVSFEAPDREDPISAITSSQTRSVCWRPGSKPEWSWSEGFP